MAHGRALTWIADSANDITSTKGTFPPFFRSSTINNNERSFQRKTKNTTNNHISRLMIKPKPLHRLAPLPNDINLAHKTALCAGILPAAGGIVLTATGRPSRQGALGFKFGKCESRQACRRLWSVEKRVQLGDCYGTYAVCTGVRPAPWGNSLRTATRYSARPGECR